MASRYPGSGPWLEVVPSGPYIGDVDLTCSAEAYTGRKPREVVFDGIGQKRDGSPLTANNKGHVIQYGKGTTSGSDGFIKIETVTPSGVAYSGGTATVDGKSNLAHLFLTIPTDGVTDATVSSVVIAGHTLEQEDITNLTGLSGYTIPNDPGASAEYTFSIQFTIGANASDQKTFSGNIGESLNPKAPIEILQYGEGQEGSLWFYDSVSSEPSQTNVSVNISSNGGTVTKVLNASPNTTQWTLSQIDSN